MGNLFSDPKPPPPTTNTFRTYRTTTPTTNTFTGSYRTTSPTSTNSVPTYRSSRPGASFTQESSNFFSVPGLDDFINDFQRLTLQHNKVAKPQPVVKNVQLIRELLQNIDGYDVEAYFGPYQRTLLDESSQEYLVVNHKFRSTNKKCFRVTRIEKIDNTYLKIQYNLQKMQYKKRYGHVEEKLCFHGTKLANVHSICANNFDWRLRGNNRGHIFGQGVSFTPISNYATHYGDKTPDKVMILAKVLVSKQCIGDKTTEVPPDGYDTTTKQDGHVIVKYDDNTFYPAFVIYYSGVDVYNKPNQKFVNRPRYVWVDDF